MKLEASCVAKLLPVYSSNIKNFETIPYVSLDEFPSCISYICRLRRKAIRKAISLGQGRVSCKW